MVLVIVGFLALVTPFSPGSWLILIGFELLGLRFLLEDKLPDFLRLKPNSRLRRLLKRTRRKPSDSIAISWEGQPRLVETIAKLEDVRQEILQKLPSLPITTMNKVTTCWRQRPKRDIEGAEETVKFIIETIKDEASLIREHVSGIQSLKVSVAQLNDPLAPEGLSIILWREFTDGNIDGVPHIVARTGERKFTFGYVPT